MENVNWTVVLVVAIICYTLYAITDIGNEARRLKGQADRSESEKDE